MSFATEVTLTGPLRSPAQLLAEQEVDGHASIHDGDAAASLGLAGAPIEGPTHFSQFDPLLKVGFNHIADGGYDFAADRSLYHAKERCPVKEQTLKE